MMAMLRPFAARLVSPPRREMPYAALVGLQARGESPDPRFRPFGGQRQRQQIAERLGALGGEIGEVHPERLLRAIDSGGSSAKKCTPAAIRSVVTTRSSPGRGLRRAASSTRPSAAAALASGAK